MLVAAYRFRCFCPTVGLGELPLHCVTATQPPGSGPGIVRVHDRLEDGGGRCGRRWDDQPQYPGIKRFILRPAAGGNLGLRNLR